LAGASVGELVGTSAGELVGASVGELVGASVNDVSINSDFKTKENKDVLKHLVLSLSPNGHASETLPYKALDYQ
jgi:hypothetical protein